MSIANSPFSSYYSSVYSNSVYATPPNSPPQNYYNCSYNNQCAAAYYYGKSPLFYPPNNGVGVGVFYQASTQPPPPPQMTPVYQASYDPVYYQNPQVSQQSAALAASSAAAYQSYYSNYYMNYMNGYRFPSPAQYQEAQYNRASPAAAVNHSQMSVPMQVSMPMPMHEVAPIADDSNLRPKCRTNCAYHKASRKRDKSEKQHKIMVKDQISVNKKKTHQNKPHQQHKQQPQDHQHQQHIYVNSEFLSEKRPAASPKSTATSLKQRVPSSLDNTTFSSEDTTNDKDEVIQQVDIRGDRGVQLNKSLKIPSSIREEQQTSDSTEIKVRKKFTFLGVFKANPNEYVEQFGQNSAAHASNQVSASALARENSEFLDYDLERKTRNYLKQVLQIKTAKALQSNRCSSRCPSSTDYYSDQPNKEKVFRLVPEESGFISLVDVDH